MNESPISDAVPLTLRHDPARRKLLGALALGFVASACSAEDSPDLAIPSADTPDRVAVPDPGRTLAASDQTTGPELVRVTLPGRSDSLAPAPALPQAGPAVVADAEVRPPGIPEPSPPGSPVAQPTTTEPPSSTAPPSTAAPTTTAFTPPRGLPTNASAVHVANRLTFGLTPEIEAELARRGTGGFVEDQLARTGPDPEAENRLGRFRLLGRGRKATYDRLRDIGNNQLGRELTHLNVLRATYSRHQLYEMMCHLWMDHFNVNLFGEGRTRHLHLDHQENVIRPNAMGSFRDLLVATANSPAMLTYLDNDRSDANSDQGVNENYGRELLELHSLGIRPDGSHDYDEADVRAVAQVMSGWSIERDRNAGTFTDFRFRAEYHHRQPVSILGGAWRSDGLEGKAAGDSLLGFLAVHPSTAAHVAYKICRRFVADQPPSALVESTAQVFLANDTQLVPTLRHVLSSAEFAASEGQKLRRPFEAMVATLRALGSTIPDDPDGRSARRLRSRLSDQNHEPWAWDAPNGYPDDAGHWLSADGMLNRWNLAVRLARDAETRGGDGDRIRTDYGRLRPAAASVGELTAQLADRFGLGELPDATIAAIAAAARAEPGQDAGQLDDEQLADIAGLLFAHPLFQTR